MKTKRPKLTRPEPEPLTPKPGGPIRKPPIPPVNIKRPPTMGGDDDDDEKSGFGKTIREITEGEGILKKIFKTKKTIRIGKKKS